MTLTPTLRDTIAADLAESPGAVIEEVAKRHSVAPKEVLALLPEAQVTTVDGTHFETVMGEMTAWGEVTFIVNTGDVILEAKGAVPPGRMGQGYYNLHGKPIGGHLRANHCDLIAFVSRKLFKSDTHSVQFYNQEGGCMFKVYLGRDTERRLIPEQVAHFRALRDRLVAA